MRVQAQQEVGPAVDEDEAGRGGLQAQGSGLGGTRAEPAFDEEQERGPERAEGEQERRGMGHESRGVPQGDGRPEHPQHGPG